MRPFLEDANSSTNSENPAVIESGAEAADQILSDAATGDIADQRQRQPVPVLPATPRNCVPAVSMDRVSTIHLGRCLGGDHDLPLFERAPRGVAQAI